MASWLEKAQAAAPVGAGIARAAAGLNPWTAVAAALSEIPGACRTRRWTLFVNELLSAYSQELDVIVERVTDPGFADLLEHAHGLAESSRSDEKIRLAAWIVAEVLAGAQDTESIGNANILLDLIEPLEKHHLRVFATLGSPKRGEGQMAGETVVGGWTTQDLQAALPHIAGVIPVIVATLTSVGLAVDHSAASITYGGKGPETLGLTAAGTWLFDHLQTYGTDPPPR